MARTLRGITWIRAMRSAHGVHSAGFARNPSVQCSVFGNNDPVHSRPHRGEHSAMTSWTPWSARPATWSASGLASRRRSIPPGPPVAARAVAAGRGCFFSYWTARSRTGSGREPRPLHLLVDRPWPHGQWPRAAAAPRSSAVLRGLATITPTHRLSTHCHTFTLPTASGGSPHRAPDAQRATPAPASQPGRRGRAPAAWTAARFRP